MPSVDPAHPRPPCFLVCAQCSARIAHSSQVVSRAFRGHAGKAALFTSANNVVLDPPSILLMDSGAYTIQEFVCNSCESYLGWKFLRAHDGPERWKEGHYILELDLVLELEHEHDGAPHRTFSPDGQSPLGRIDEEPPHAPTHRRTPSAPPAAPPKGVQHGVRSQFAAPKRTQHAPRPVELDDYDGGGGGPFWKPR